MLVMKITNSVKWTDKRSDLFYLIYWILLLNIEKIKSFGVQMQTITETMLNNKNDAYLNITVVKNDHIPI